MIASKDAQISPQLAMRCFGNSGKRREIDVKQAKYAAPIKGRYGPEEAQDLHEKNQIPGVSGSLKNKTVIASTPRTGIARREKIKRRLDTISP